MFKSLELYKSFVTLKKSYEALYDVFLRLSAENSIFQEVANNLEILINTMNEKFFTILEPIEQHLSFAEIDQDERRDFKFFFEKKEYKFLEFLKFVKKEAEHPDAYIYSDVRFFYNSKFREVLVVDVYLMPSSKNDLFVELKNKSLYEKYRKN